MPCFNYFRHLRLSENEISEATTHGLPIRVPFRARSIDSDNPKENVQFRGPVPRRLSLECWSEKVTCLLLLVQCNLVEDWGGLLCKDGVLVIMFVILIHLVVKVIPPSFSLLPSMYDNPSSFSLLPNHGLLLLAVPYAHRNLCTLN